MPQIVWEKIFVMWTTSKYTFYFSLDVDLPKEKSLEDRLEDSVANHPCHHHHHQRQQLKHLIICSYLSEITRALNKIAHLLIPQIPNLLFPFPL